MRFWNFGSIPFMHDEFSAIFRTWYHSVSDLIEIGVKQNDSHPAGVQLFLYFWLKLFGLSEPVLKFPFAFLGWASVLLVWVIARKWFNNDTALFTAAIMAVTQYNIFYSQLARPYAPGLFFTLVAAWFWTKVVFDNNTKKKEWILFVFFVALNSYIHAFTLFFNLLMAVTGLFFVRKQKLKHYLFAGGIILLLYLPGISVFLFQIKRGDIGGWLGKPKPDFLINYFGYIFHFSWWFLFTVVALVLFLSIKYFNNKPENNKYRFIGVSWFLVTFLVAFLYSIYRSPIIQYSTLLFVFPFLLMVFFSFFDNLPAGIRNLSLVLILFVGIFTLVFDRQHYTEMYNQGFDRIPLQVINDMKKYPDKKVAIVLQSPNTRMFDYYFEKYGQNPDYFRLEKNNNMAQINRFLIKNEADIVLFGCSDYSPLDDLVALKEKYPFVGKRLGWFNSEYWVLSSKKLRTRYNCRNEDVELGYVESFRIPVKSKYGHSIKLNTDSILFRYNSVIYAKAVVKSEKVTSDARLVFDWRDEHGKTFFWAAAPFKKFISPDTTFVVTTSLRVRDLPAIPRGGTIKFYIWKKDASIISVLKMQAGLITTYPVEMGLYESF